MNWERLLRLRRIRRLQNVATLGLVLLGPGMVLATFLVLGPLDKGVSSMSLRLVVLADLVYVIIVAALVLQRVARMVAARRAQSVGSRLHLRLTATFAAMALIPTVSVAVFAALTINIGLEGWFSDRVRNVVGASLSAARAYEEEHQDDLTQDANALARLLDASRDAAFFVGDAELRQVLTSGQGQIQRGLKEAYVIDGAGEIRARGERSYLFDFEKPEQTEMTAARGGEVAVIEDWDNNEFRALVALKRFPDRYLYVSREVDGKILNLLDDTQQSVLLYQQLESERGRVLFEFALLYLGFALILILAATWLGLWFAERLARPIGRLASAAEQVREGNLHVRVHEEDGNDEIAMLSRHFNQMVLELRNQRGALLDNTAQIEQRRRLFDSVLSSVTSGVVGLDATGRVTFVNRSAERLLDWREGKQHMAIGVAVPEFGPLFETLRRGGGQVAQEEIKVSRNGRLENLLVRMATRRNADGDREGYVVAFDDVTDLVTAQRMAAWGDVARRIAHEIKNPLTPIKLSAERIRRKFGRHLDEQQAGDLENLTDVIVRQTDGLRRIVDEFSRFARMPEPQRRAEDLAAILRDAVLLQQSGQPGVSISLNMPEGDAPAEVDATMITQALTNLIKNAGEATDTLAEKGAPDGWKPEIRVSLDIEQTETLPEAVIRISDNGIGLPEDRAKLFEPYVTTRDTGTGLGLPIVKKIVEEHGGTLILDTAPVFDGATHAGAMAVVRLTLNPAETGGTE
ncbi:sensor histidine kinase NtrY-like [Pseudooceanicola algae]|uniref:histidine kinase n=1 Tax=Pseudooceanicola algae TaxID=1537215 RepID=A0A418SEM3_9RHOB|nr:PAS domain-containing sensor histidine kinase [Pseudooceanicola algae]QPM89768.1 Adaptive-response sensory-kinase SasA [Pseudooceanicola algae]